MTMYEKLKSLIRELEASPELPNNNPMPNWDYARFPQQRERYDMIRNACVSILGKAGSEDEGMWASKAEIIALLDYIAEITLIQ